MTSEIQQGWFGLGNWANAVHLQYNEKRLLIYPYCQEQISRPNFKKYLLFARGAL